MEVKKVILGANPTALIDPIPDSCVRDRTITLNKLKELRIFPDRRPTARKWISENIPRLLIMDDVKKEKFVIWFFEEMPSNGWLEFDFGKKTLHLCTLEKK
jgi:hypothetical protein